MNKHLFQKIYKILQEKQESAVFEPSPFLTSHLSSCSARQRLHLIGAAKSPGLLPLEGFLPPSCLSLRLSSRWVPRCTGNCLLLPSPCSWTGDSALNSVSLRILGPCQPCLGPWGGGSVPEEGSREDLRLLPFLCLSLSNWNEHVNQREFCHRPHGPDSEPWLRDFALERSRP